MELRQSGLVNKAFTRLFISFSTETKLKRVFHIMESFNTLFFWFEKIQISKYIRLLYFSLLIYLQTRFNFFLLSALSRGNNPFPKNRYIKSTKKIRRRNNKKRRLEGIKPSRDKKSSANLEFRIIIFDLVPIRLWVETSERSLVI